MNHKAVLIGAGDRGSVYALASVKSGLEIGCIYDIDESRALKLKERLKDHCNPVIAHSLDEALETPGADLAFICIPAYFHADYSIRAIEKGLNVLSEKPFDLDYSKVRKVCELAKERGKVLAVGHQYHNFRNLHSLKTIMEQDLIGRPAVLRFTDLRERRPKLAMHDAKEGNCGPLLDMSCHFVDLMCWAFDSKPVKVTARRNTYAAGDERYAAFECQAPDTGVIMVEFESGDIGMISVCWGMVKGVGDYSPIDGFGPKGFIRGFELWKTTETVIVNTDKGDIPIEFSEEEMKDFEMAEKTTLQYVLDAIEGKGEIQVPLEEACNAYAATLAGLKASTTLESVLVEEIVSMEPNTVQCLGK